MLKIQDFKSGDTVMIVPLGAKGIIMVGNSDACFIVNKKFKVKYEDVFNEIYGNYEGFIFRAVGGLKNNNEHLANCRFVLFEKKNKRFIELCEANKIY